MFAPYPLSQNKKIQIMLKKQELALAFFYCQIFFNVYVFLLNPQYFSQKIICTHSI